jgi:hypothetical protein
VARIECQRLLEGPHLVIGKTKPPESGAQVDPKRDIRAVPLQRALDELTRRFAVAVVELTHSERVEHEWMLGRRGLGACQETFALRPLTRRESPLGLLDGGPYL